MAEPFDPNTSDSQAFFDNKLVGMVQRDSNSNYVRFNRRWIEMTGYRPEELISLKPEQIIHPDDLPERRQWTEQLQTGSCKSFRTTRRYIRKDGEIFWGDVSSTGLYDHLGHYLGTISLIVDVTDQKRAMVHLEESERRYKALLNNQNDVILLHRALTDDYAPFTEVNDAAIRRYGYSREELLTMSIRDLADPEITHQHRQSAFLTTIVEKGLEVFESVHIAKDGTRIPVEVSATLVDINGATYFLSTARDIRERKAAELKQRQLEQQLHQKYKMEAVGLLAGGIAHNFNNSLGIVLGNIELALNKLDRPAETESYLKRAKEAILHSRNLVRQILSYSRQESHSQVPGQLTTIIEQAMQMIRPTIPSSVDLVCRGCGQHATILADASRIQEALINLCNNAVQAMNEKGRLTIALDVVAVSPSDIPRQAECSPGQYARLSVSDTGCGMAPETLEKIFDPFFTTKPVHEGTGIGLTTVQGIVSQHGGFIRVASRPFVETTFELYFPLVADAPEETGVVADLECLSGSERILIVDDDETLASLSESMLEDAGYQVTVETDSARALELLTSHSADFDLLITDQTMPKLTGYDLIREVRKIKPQLPTILCTGYSSQISEPEARALGVNAYCLKPIEMSEFLKTIRTVLTESETV